MVSTTITSRRYFLEGRVAYSHTRLSNNSVHTAIIIATGWARPPHGAGLSSRECTTSRRRFFADRTRDSSPRGGSSRTDQAVTRVCASRRTPFTFFGVPRPGSGLAVPLRPALGGGGTRPGHRFKESHALRPPLYTPTASADSTPELESADAARRTHRKPKKQLWAVDHSARASMKSAASCVT